VTSGGGFNFFHFPLPHDFLIKWKIIERCVGIYKEIFKPTALNDENLINGYEKY
jgi:hypothetical protein